MIDLDEACAQPSRTVLDQINESIERREKHLEALRLLKASLSPEFLAHPYAEAALSIFDNF